MDELFEEDILERIVGYATSASLNELGVVLCEVFNRLPEDVAAFLLEDRGVHFVCPQIGTVARVGGPAIVENDLIARWFGWFVLLSTDLIDQPRDEQIYTIVHELAHVYREDVQGGPGGPLPKNVVSPEVASDQLVIDWGFEKELKAAPETYIGGYKKWG